MGFCASRELISGVLPGWGFKSEVLSSGVLFGWVLSVYHIKSSLGIIMVTHFVCLIVCKSPRLCKYSEILLIKILNAYWRSIWQGKKGRSDQIPKMQTKSYSLILFWGNKILTYSNEVLILRNTILTYCNEILVAC